MSSYIISLFYYFFFFSSRRRHTRCLSDWSSDVCSSDLEAAQIVYQAVWADPSPTDPSRTYHSAAQALLNELCQRAGIVRSEERRVGKECRSRRSWYDERKKKRREIE